ncbi:MAG: lysophospholipid acyltransferase family protein [Planctomycetota bacterium]
MKLSKRILKHRLTQALLVWLVAQYIRVVWYTSRWEHRHRERVEPLVQGDGPLIVAFWHGRLMMTAMLWRRPGQDMYALISEHRDGRLISDAVGYLGIKTVVGSTSKGGSKALREMVKLLKQGDSLTVTPDGPRGPSMQAAGGVVQLARLGGAPIVPISYSVTRGKHAGSWDRFLIPYPFTRGVVTYGQPITLGKRDDLEEATLRLETELVALTQEADQACGRETPPSGLTKKSKNL